MKKCKHDYSRIVTNEKTKCLKCGLEVSYKQIRYDLLIQSFIENGFTKKQAKFLINTLEDYIPLI